MNFWQKLRERGPIFILAPMADVTDSAFRYVISKNSDIPHVTYTEFVSADGLVLAPEAGKQKLLKDLVFSEIERPIVAQLFSGKPAMMEKAAALALELGFDGVDINMGCPDRAIEKQGAGAGLIKNPALAQELILAAKRGVQNKIPVSVKTRLGYNKDELETWLPALLEAQPAVIIIHARTRKEMSKVPARWERIRRAVEIRNQVQNCTPPPENSFQISSPKDQKCTDKILLNFSSCSPQSGSQAIFDSFGSKSKDHPKTLIIGNGDVVDIDDAKGKCEETLADGVMLGRAVFGNPFLFRTKPPTVQEKLEALITHTNLFAEQLGGVKSFAIMKKHFKSYLKEVEGAKDLKQALMEARLAAEVQTIVEKIIALYN